MRLRYFGAILLYLDPLTDCQQGLNCADIVIQEHRGQFAQVPQFVVLDIVLLVLGKTINEHDAPAASSNLSRSA
jgi:hypothetical protein